MISINLCCSVHYNYFGKVNIRSKKRTLCLTNDQIFSYLVINIYSNNNTFIQILIKLFLLILVVMFVFLFLYLGLFCHLSVNVGLTCAHSAHAPLRQLAGVVSEKVSLSLQAHLN